METRIAKPDDAPAIAAIYNQGIEDRIATFETRLRSETDMRAWFEDTAHPIVVVTDAGSSDRLRHDFDSIVRVSVTPGSPSLAFMLRAIHAAKGRGGRRCWR